MESGRLDHQRFSFPDDTGRSKTRLPNQQGDLSLEHTIQKTVQFFKKTQKQEGYWVGELEGDSILQSEYILLLTWLGEAETDAVSWAAKTILKQQEPHGGWAQYPGGPTEVSASVKAYLSLKIAGHAPDEACMLRAKAAILEAGGVERVNSFTRYYLALLGLIPYHKCPAVPPEMVLLPRWFPINLYEMSAWSRTIVVPLSFLWAYQPKCDFSKTIHPKTIQIDELYTTSKEQLSATLNTEEVIQLDTMKKRSLLPWGWIFRQLDKGIKLVDRFRLNPFRGYAMKKAKQWMLKRFKNSDGLGAIFPPIVWSIVALKCLGYKDDSSEITEARKQLDRLVINDERGYRLQPCHSPVWDTAICTLSLRDAGVPVNDPAIRKAVAWLLEKEVRQPGDWTVKNKGVEPSGWFFEHRNQFYPDVDDTIMVLMVLGSCLPGESHIDWKVEFLNHLNHQKEEIPTLVSGRTSKPSQAVFDATAMQPLLDAIRRAMQWTLSMQSKDGGWGAFDVDNNCELLTRVPFADHNAMIDPSHADISARVLEMLGRLGVPKEFPAIQKAIAYISSEQEDDGSWYGRWGVNYIYGTWQVIVGLTTIGISTEDARIQKGADWLEVHQQENGGWGESPRSYDCPTWKGRGTPTPSQTAWAVMGLIAAGKADSNAVKKGIQFLTQTQNEEGTWDEEEFTGTGFPKVFYLRYHMYRNYFPLMAFAKYRSALHSVLQKNDLPDC